MPLCLQYVCVHVCISVLGLCPARYMCLYVYELSCDNASVRNLKECVWFYNTIACVIHFQRTNSGIQFDRCEPSQRNVFIAVRGKKRLYCCCKTIIHVNILSYNQPIVSLYLRYSQWGFGRLALRCTYHRPVINAVVGNDPVYFKNCWHKRRELLIVDMFLWWSHTHTHARAHTHAILSRMF